MQSMVNDGLSTREIKDYLRRFVMWWVNTSDTWTAPELLTWFIEYCWDSKLAAIAASLRHHYTTKLNNLMAMEQVETRTVEITAV